MSTLKLIQMLLHLINVQTLFPAGTVPPQLVATIQKVLNVIENLNLQTPNNVEADLADLMGMIAALEAALGNQVPAGALGDVLAAIEKFPQEVSDLQNGQFVKAFEVTESLGGKTETFLVGAMLKGGSAAALLGY
jgi:hypothetical protein